MALYGKHESLKLADDPSDPAWRWFILNGPHGERFTWKRFGTLPSDLEMLTKFIDERNQIDPGFRNQVRKISCLCLLRQNKVLVRTAIQVLTVVGDQADMEIVGSFIHSDDLSVKNDAACALFERGME